MDETTKAIISRITKQCTSPRPLPSGNACSVFYDCLELTPNDLARLAAEATGDLPESIFDVAVGLAYTGIFFAAAVAGGRQVGVLQSDNSYRGPDIEGKNVVVVDDVVHSGNRIRRAAETLEKAGARVVGFVAIVDRSNGEIGTAACPLWSAHQTIME